MIRELLGVAGYAVPFKTQSRSGIETSINSRTDGFKAKSGTAAAQGGGDSLPYETPPFSLL